MYLPRREYDMDAKFIDKSITSFKVRENDRALAAIELIRSRDYEAAIAALCDANAYAALASEYEFIFDYEEVSGDD